MTTPTTRSLATEALSHFAQGTRDNGSTYWYCDDTSPDWLESLCLDAHGDLLPNDWRYDFIVRSLSALSESDDPDTARDSLEPDIYTAELTAWLASHGERLGYVDEYVSEYGWPGTFEALQGGQLAEMQEVYSSVYTSLDNLTETDDDA